MLSFDVTTKIKLSIKIIVAVDTLECFLAAFLLAHRTFFSWNCSIIVCITDITQVIFYLAIFAGTWIIIFWASLRYIFLVLVLIAVQLVAVGAA